MVPMLSSAMMQLPGGHASQRELGLWFAIRDALRPGRLYRPTSRRYADPTGFLTSSVRSA